MGSVVVIWMTGLLRLVRRKVWWPRFLLGKLGLRKLASASLGIKLSLPLQLRGKTKLRQVYRDADRVVDCLTILGCSSSFVPRSLSDKERARFDAAKRAVILISMVRFGFLEFHRFVRSHGVLEVVGGNSCCSRLSNVCQ